MDGLFHLLFQILSLFYFILIKFVLFFLLFNSAIVMNGLNIFSDPLYILFHIILF